MDSFDASPGEREIAAHAKAKARNPPHSLMPDPRELLDRLESRHDELIRKLDELNVQIEAALAQFGKSQGNSSKAVDESTEPPNEMRSVRRAA